MPVYLEPIDHVDQFQYGQLETAVLQLMYMVN